MKKVDTQKTLTIRGLLLITSVAVLGVAFAGAASWNREITPPSVPDKLEVEAGNEPFLLGRGVGTQNYSCQPSGAGVAWVLFTPQATLFDDYGRQLITHFSSPNPIENNLVRVSWQHSRDTSRVWAKLVQAATAATDPAFVRPDAVAWVLLNVKDTGALAGPTGGNTLTKTTFIQRVHTEGGLAPSTGCLQPSDLGNKAFVPYRADYFFYKKAD
jgi:uncharacterized protein DUF3455